MTSEQLTEVNKSIEEWGLENVVNVILIKSGATNGDVIKAMFPKAYVDESRYETPFIDVMYGGEVKSFSETWWNAPYQKGGKG